MAFLTVVINTSSMSVSQLNQLQQGSTHQREEINALINYLSRVAGGNEIVPTFYVVTNNSDPTVATDGGSSTKTTYTNP